MAGINKVEAALPCVWCTASSRLQYITAHSQFSAIICVLELCSLGVVLGCVLPGALCGACWLGCGCWLGCAGLVCSVWAAWWCSLPWLFSVSRFSLFTVFHFSYRDLRLMLVSGVPGLVQQGSFAA
ncbi:Hypothetical_protein [Hexamita inflata]|uniref:Hypothetical_protein n=1 Tax=Hexamita inflata TaxID=28002 RepID=A0AA86TSQ6_9EUKA|nr:Hypothetical protein HINF_LOCUS8613 [Hexamita inflata]